MSELPHPDADITTAYAEAIGRATFNFACMEWNAIWCCEAMSDGFMRNLGHRTAGQVGEDFEDLARAIPEQHLRNAVVGAADQFRHLVHVRNALQHGKPGRGPDGHGALVHDGRPWTLAMVLNAAHEFGACSRRLERLLEERLGGREAAAR